VGLTRDARLFRVFISSPGDVAEERTAARRVVESVLPQKPALKGRISFEVVAWDHPEGGVAMPAGLTPQEAVNRGLPKPSECDLTVVILWSRMGTPLPADEYKKDDGSPYLSGTEWEYEDALRADPTRVFAYRCTREPPLPGDRARRREFLEQVEKVEAFLDRFKNPDGSLRGSVTSYTDTADFERKLAHDLESVILAALGPAASTPPKPPPLTGPLAPYGIPTTAPADFRADMEQFLATYLGSAAKSVPFGGRAGMLAELDRWLADPHAPRRLLLWGPAGRGKSALVVRWLGHVAASHHLIFLPVSIRFGTNRAELFYHALAAALAVLLGEELKPPPADPVEHYKGFAVEWLRRTDHLGKPLLLVVDGLDEAAGWDLDPALLPHDPTPSLRVLVSARLQIGDRGAEGWLGRLRWDELGPRPADMEVPCLDRTGIADVLRSMGDPLAGLATTIDAPEQLAYLTEGDPLLVRLYVEDLLKQGEAAARLRPEELAGLRPGFGPYFARWLAEEERRWRAAGLAVDRATVDTILALLACALGPLKHADLAALCRRLRGPSFTLPRHALDPLCRFVLGDGREQGYVLTHPKLGRYLREEHFADPEETAAAERAFLDWGRDVVRRLNSGELPTDDAPDYLLFYHREHLGVTRAPLTDFMALVEDGWRRAREGREGGPRGFAADVGAAWAWARTLDDGTPEGLSRSLPGQLRCALVLSSLASIGGNIPQALLTAAVRERLLSLPQALHFTSFLDPGQRCHALGALAPHLPEGERAAVLAQALAAARGSADGNGRAGLLAALALHLPEGLLAEALAAARDIADGGGRAWVLAELAPRLPEGERAAVLAEALADARGSARGGRSAWVLAALAPHLPEGERAAVLAQALADARGIARGDNRARALTALAPHLPEGERAAVLAEALAAARGIADGNGRAWALAELAPRLPEEKRAAVLAQALAAARGIARGDDRAQVLRELAPCLNGQLSAVALRDLLGIVHRLRRSQLLDLFEPFGPLLARFGGVETIRELRRAIRDTAAWYP
jgi:hypothetical protein